MDFASYYTIYHDLNGFTAGASQYETTPLPPHVLSPLQDNYNGAGDTYGLELQTQWQVTDAWRLTAGYTWLHMRLEADNTTERISPQHQFNLRSYLDITRHVELNSVIYYVNQTLHPSDPTIFTVPSYVRLDLGATWRPTKHLELSIWGQNLLDDGHSEFTSVNTSFLTEVPRGVFGKITWRF